MALINRAQIAIVAPRARADIVAGISDHADDVLPRYGMATRARLVDFMAHILEETGGLTVLEENLHYSAERAHEVWPSRFPTVASAAPYANNPQALANCVYGGRMGNVGPNDGWLTRGQGLLQTTGMANMTALGKRMGKTVEEVLAMLTSEAGMLECAVASYVMTGAAPYADKGDIIGSTRKVNGGLLNIDRRETYRAQCLKIWSDEIMAPRRAIGFTGAMTSGIKIDSDKPVLARIETAIDRAAAAAAITLPKPVPYTAPAIQQHAPSSVPAKSWWAWLTGRK